MRPLKLIMNAFGPYKEKVVIDFTQFTQSSLFLVSGPTGAGKTTIFDAIAYALFDSGSGDSREKDTFKSDFSKDTDLCYVELEFELGTERYFIHRQPTQIGPGTRTKTKQIQSNVEFHHNGKISSKVTEANAEIQQLIGLTYDQFRQIVMLPQGAFKKMLESNSREKETIFRNIFQTNAFQSIEEKLKEKARGLAKKREEYAMSLEQAFSRIETEETESLEKAIDHFDTEAVLLELNQLIEKEEKELKEARENLSLLMEEKNKQERLIDALTKKEELEKEKVELDATENTVTNYEKQLQLHEQAVKLVEAEHRLNEVGKEKEDKETSLTKHIEAKKEYTEQVAQLESNLKEIQNEVNSLDSVRETIQNLKEEQKLREEWKEKQKKIHDMEKQTQHALKTKTDDENTLEKIGKQLKENQTKIEELRAVRDGLPKQLHEINEKKEERSKLSNRLEKLTELCSLRDKGAVVKGEFSKVTTQLSQAREKWQSARTAYYSNISVVLAGDLEDNQPCPVCGSTEHPNKAHSTGEEVSKEHVEQLEQKKNKVENTYNQLALQIQHLSDSASQLCQRLEVESDDALEAREQAKQEVKELETNLSDLESQFKENEEKAGKEGLLKDTLEILQKEERELSLSIQKNESHREQLLTRIGEVKDEAQEIEEKLRYETEEEITQEIIKNEDIIKAVDKQLKEKQKASSHAQSGLASTLKAIELTEDQIGNLKKKETEREEVLDNLKEASELDEEYAQFVLEDKQVSLMKETVSGYKEKRAIHSSRLEETHAFLEKEKEVQAKDDHIEKLKKVSLSIPEKEERRDKLLRLSSQNQQAADSISLFKEQSAQIEEDYQLYGELSRMASGMTKDTDYVSFERFVLGIYFEEILHAANTRFTQMTNSRFALHRKTEKAKGAGPQGLDINVFDHYTGKVRGVNTLSGGETFKASLALALGLSDVIQSKSGGVRVDTLFVDEGFGTLDSDSLDMAIQTLLDLHKNGRMVGIISHVDELKTRIPSHIVVEKTSAGSRAYVKN